MHPAVIVLVVIAALIVLPVLAFTGFALYARGKVRRGFETQRAQVEKFPDWANGRGLTYLGDSDDVPIQELVANAPFRDFVTPGSFTAGNHIFSGHVDGRRSLVLQLLVYADPRPGARPNGALTVAATKLSSPTTESSVKGNGRDVPHIHAVDHWVTSYIGGPLTLERADLVYDRLVEYVDTSGMSS
jgi:hypothetical protein